MRLYVANTPHNPVRYENSVGIVVEQDRPIDKLDTMRWYCKNCKNIVYEKSFQLVDLGTQIKQAIVEFDNDINERTCSNCGTVATSK
jgi:3-hydroxyanthranilate 3,4-dioxygenase